MGVSVDERLAKHSRPRLGGVFCFLEVMVDIDETRPYFFNPGMSPEQTEHWLGQQKLHLSYYNKLIKEKAALTERLNEISEQIDQIATFGFEGKLRFPSDPNPLLESHQQSKQ